jgi:CheY-like chemotaxis protein
VQADEAVRTKTVEWIGNGDVRTTALATASEALRALESQAFDCVVVDPGLRKPVADAMAGREAASIHEFVDIWYSEPTWTNLRSITIR